MIERLERAGGDAGRSLLASMKRLETQRSSPGRSPSGWQFDTRGFWADDDDAEEFSN